MLKQVQHDDAGCGGFGGYLIGVGRQIAKGEATGG